MFFSPGCLRPESNLGRKKTHTLIAFVGVIQLSADPPATLTLASSRHDLSNFKSFVSSSNRFFQSVILRYFSLRGGRSREISCSVSSCLFHHHKRKQLFMFQTAADTESVFFSFSLPLWLESAVTDSQESIQVFWRGKQKAERLQQHLPPCPISDLPRLPEFNK